MIKKLNEINGSKEAAKVIEVFQEGWLNKIEVQFLIMKQLQRMKNFVKNLIRKTIGLLIQTPKETNAKNDLFLKKQSLKIPYKPTNKERKIIKKLLDMDDKTLDMFEIYKCNGNVFVRSPRRDWRTLSGREWEINLQKRTCRCVCMSQFKHFSKFK